MIAKTVFILLAFHSSILGSVTSDSSVRDTLALKLHKRVAAYNLGVCTPVEGLIRVSSDFQIPIGIVWVNTPEATAESSFAWKDATVQEIIKTLAKAQPRYQFESRNGVVHVFPPGAIPRSQDFLKLKIESFEVRNDLIELASFKLHTLVTPLRAPYTISIGATGDSKVDLSLKNSSVEDIMDALAVASNRKIWIVAFSNDPGLTPAGFHRTISLWTDKAIADSDQPVWEFMRWGDPFPPRVKK